ncbi:MAG: hypothetical protein ACR2RL_21760 [Gammaproteobacteria bacterium]
MANVTGDIQFRQGVAAALPATGLQGEPLWVTDNQQLYIGSGAGRVLIGDANAAPHAHANKALLDLAPAALGTTLQVLRVNAGVTALEFATLNAAGVPSTAAGNLTSTDVQAALQELQTDIDNLGAIAADNFISLGANPVPADGVDGNYAINVVSGDIFGPRAGTWPGAPVGNAYATIGLSSVAGAAATAAGAVGTGVVPSRADHSHPFQNAAQTTNAAIVGLTATNVQAALAELAGNGTTQAAAVALNTAAQHTHTNKAAIDTIPTPLAADVGEFLTVTGAGTFGTVAAPAGTTTWLGLTDTPAAFVASKLTASNAGGTAIEFVDGISGGTF